MQHKKIAKSLDQFLEAARRRKGRHFRSFRYAGILVGCVVPLVVVASGSSLGTGSLIGFAIVAYGAWWLCRHLGRGRSSKLYDALAQELAGKFPEDSAAYQQLLHCLITVKPRKGLADELIRRVPGAEQLDVMTGGGAVAFDKVPEPNEPAPASVMPEFKDPKLQDLMVELSKGATPSHESLSAFLKQHPNAKTIVTKQKNGAGGSVHSVQVFTSSGSSGSAELSDPPPAPDATPPETAEPRQPDFIPLSPCEPGKR